MRGETLKIVRLGLVASAAALAVVLAGMQVRAEAPALQLAQADAGEAAVDEADAAAEETETAAMPEFTEEVLADPETIALGRDIWVDQCRHCHGASAYPGKAPRLRPRRYTPDFVYHRVTFGFRGMPGWEEVFSEEERVAVTAYVMSREFSP